MPLLYNLYVFIITYITISLSKNNNLKQFEWTFTYWRNLHKAVFEDARTSTVDITLDWDNLNHSLDIEASLHKKWSFPLKISSVHVKIENFNFCAVLKTLKLRILGHETRRPWCIKKKFTSILPNMRLGTRFL